MLNSEYNFLLNDRIQKIQSMNSEYNFLLNDRIQKIQSMNSEYNFLLNGYVSFSGGKDSTVLSELIDMALPNNRIPRVYINTGIEYKAIVDFVMSKQKNDDRIVIIKPTQNIKKMLEEYGYPFKSKEHSQKVATYQKSGLVKTVTDYLGVTGNKQKSFCCPDKLKYQFTDKFSLKVSDKCCYKMKKEPVAKWAKENNRSITITGIRQGEGGLRTSMQGCAVFTDNTCKVLKKFHPLFPISEEWEDEFIRQNDVKLCKLYYSPYNFERTGCKGCPYARDLQRNHDVMALYLPSEERQCEMIWKPVYDEYRKIGYRLEYSLF